MKRVYSLLFLLLFLSASSVLAQDGGNIAGKWQITGTIVAMSNPTDLVKPGHQAMDEWIIEQNGTNANITDSKGVVPGFFRPDYPNYPGGVWVFEKEIPKFMGQPTLRWKLTIILFPCFGDQLKGSNSILFYKDCIEGEGGYPGGGEEWRIEGIRK